MGKPSKDLSSQELWDRLQKDSAALRKEPWGGFVRFQGVDDDAKSAVTMARSALNYGESVVAVLLDAVKKYAEVAADDREAQKATRRAQNALTVAMVFLTFVIAVSTALYTVAAWRQVPQYERATAPIVTIPLPAAPPADPQVSTHDR